MQQGVGDSISPPDAVSIFMARRYNAALLEQFATAPIRCFLRMP